jgi:hypothetical protein
VSPQNRGDGTLATSGDIERILSDTLGLTSGKTHLYVQHLRTAGLIRKHGNGPNAAHRWSTEETTNALIALASGCSLSTLAMNVSDIRALSRVPGWCHADNLEYFTGFTFWRAQTLGEFLDNLIDDHRDGSFQRWREPGAPSLLCGLTFQDSGRSVQAMAHSAGAGMVALAFGEPEAFRSYRVKHELRGDIDSSRPDSIPTIFERLAEALGP